ncbi:up-regulator of cell proliferation-like [Leucoraja erinacea]|uniref:up-regulator of cell proliferation-like n=1 Tax=Leucoraja erinaceus TaxID=7782 RepID=UPI0024544306|nr:up-regulator of cell proliferation-like [Leucoraja erinacea]
MREISWGKLDDSKPTRPEDLPWQFLQRILLANSLARNPEWPPAQSLEDRKDDVEDFNYLFEVKEPGDSGFNPLDIIAAIFLCADHSLQQELMLKMSLCQLALPFLLPEGHSYPRDKLRGPMEGSGATLLLWAMRHIVKMWCPQSPHREQPRCGDAHRDSNRANCLLPQTRKVHGVQIQTPQSHLEPDPAAAEYLPALRDGMWECAPWDIGWDG